MARKQEGEPSVPEAAKPAYDAIVGLTDRFCQAHLTHEYQMLCHKLAAALARKRPTPLTRGKQEVWACAVLRVIGWVNFLDDSSQSVEMGAVLFVHGSARHTEIDLDDMGSNCMDVADGS